MNEHDQKNRKRYEELADRARQSSIYTYSSFHSPETAGLAYEAAEDREITMWGGAENAERVVVRFGDPKEIGYEEDFPIRILYVRPKQEKFADHLTHRDFLGAILNLGIERDVIGDIIVTERSAYFLCSRRWRNTYVPVWKGSNIPQYGAVSSGRYRKTAFRNSVKKT